MSSLRLPKIYYNIQSMYFSATFDSSCLYELSNDDQGDVNKLYGVSFGMHHKNSFRIGWNCDGDRMSIYSYYYNDGVRTSREIASILPEEKIDFDIIFDRKDNLITIFGETKSRTFCKNTIYHFYKASKFSYTLFPYFGGNHVAPHDMLITIQHHN